MIKLSEFEDYIKAGELGQNDPVPLDKIDRGVSKDGVRGQRIPTSSEVG
jgi:hypothetical protein